MKKYYFIIFIVFLFLPFITKGAVLYLDSSENIYYQGDVFVVNVRIDTQGEYINIVETSLTFPLDVFEIKEVSDGDSIINLWIQEPKIIDNEIFFKGGIPGGYQGADGLIGKIAFQVRGTTQTATRDNAEINFLDSSRALLNDGRGTETDLITKDIVLNISSEEPEFSKDEWQNILIRDKSTPQAFKVEISQNPEIFEDKYFITFSTVDKESGIDYYEVKEGRKKWKTASSPYLLENQKLTSDIKVKAIDKAGNFWMETIEASREDITAKYMLWLILFVVIIVFIWLFLPEKIKRIFHE